MLKGITSIRTLALLVSLFSTHLFAQNPAGSNARRLTPNDQARFHTAVEAYEAGRFAEAQPTLQELAKIYPSDADVQTATGMLFLDSGKIELGISFLSRAYKLNPRNAAVAGNLGLAYLKTGKSSEALAPLQSACRLAPKNFANKVALAEALLSLKRYSDSATAYAEASSIPHAETEMPTAELRSQWAVALMNAGRPLEAVRVLRADPGIDQNAGLQELLGESEEKSGHFEQAFEAFKRAAELDPSESNLSSYGAELLRHWAFPSAVEIYLYGTKRYPTSDSMQMGLGTAYFGNNDFLHAAEVFQLLLQKHPDDTMMANLLGRSCSAEAAGEIAACGRLVEFARMHPENATAALYAATALMHMPKGESQEADAEALLQSAIRSNPKLPEAWYRLGSLQQSHGDWQASAVSLERAIALRPAYAEAHYRLARAYAHMDRRNDSQQEIALQQKYAQAEKEAENKRMQDIVTFITANH
jgi:tetratricopeptide (TPR) repeat protein